MNILLAFKNLEFIDSAGIDSRMDRVGRVGRDYSHGNTVDLKVHQIRLGQLVIFSRKKHIPTPDKLIIWG